MSYETIHRIVDVRCRQLLKVNAVAVKTAVKMQELANQAEIDKHSTRLPLGERGRKSSETYQRIAVQAQRIHGVYESHSVVLRGVCVRLNAEKENLKFLRASLGKNIEKNLLKKKRG